TDDFQGGLKALMDQPWGRKAVRIAISIGADADDEVLQKFIGNPEMKPLQANNPESLVRHIKWVSTAVLKSASSPASQTKDSASPVANVPIPVAPPAPAAADAGGGDSEPTDVW
ncbi:MAG TPA: tellurium resistance protein, partial [Blastocatellia bacterium]